MSGEVAAACCCGQGPAQYRVDCPQAPLEAFQRLQMSITARPIAMCPVQSLESVPWEVCGGPCRTLPIICYPSVGSPPVIGGTSARSRPVWATGLGPATAAFANFTNFVNAAGCTYRDLSYSFVNPMGSSFNCTIDEQQIDCGLPNTYTCAGGGDCNSSPGCLTVEVRNWCCDYSSCDSPYVMSYLDVTLNAIWRYEAADVCGSTNAISADCFDSNGLAVRGTWGSTEYIHQQSAWFRLYRLIPITQTVDKMVPGAYTKMQSAATANDWGQLVSAIAGSGPCVNDSEYYNPCYTGSDFYTTRIDCGDVSQLSQFGWDITATIT